MPFRIISSLIVGLIFVDVDSGIQYCSLSCVDAAYVYIYRMQMAEASDGHDTDLLVGADGECEAVHSGGFGQFMLIGIMLTVNFVSIV